ncbi:MAG: hypothetical protein AAGB00_02695 [Planctomycetota bacterium]
MAVDPYAMCPCGNGKKLKFCCGDLAADIEKIHAMIEGDQPRAALRHVEQLLAKHAGREPLLDLKVTVQFALDEFDAAGETVEAFLKAAPKSPTAHAQHAILLAARDGGRAAVVPLQQAIALVETDMPRRVLEAIGSVGQALLVEGNVVAARAHLWLYQGVSGQQDTRALQLLMRLNQVAGLPLPLRDHLYLHPAPEGHPGQTDHDRAQWYAGSGRWLPAAQAFDALCGSYPDEPTFAYNRGLLYGWLGETGRFVTGLHAFAAGDVPEEDAVEAEAIAQLLDPAMKDEPIDVVRIAYPIADEEKLVDRLASDQRVAKYEVNPEEFAEADGPPPRSAYLLLDKPLPASGWKDEGDAITRDEVPSIVGFLSHYGRQTDRAERLELVIDKNNDFEKYTSLLAEAADGSLGEAEAETRVGESDAAEQALSWRWHFPPDTPPAHRRKLLGEQRRDAILNQWPETPRRSLGGKSPREAAADPSLRVPLAAAVLLLEQGTNNHRYADAFAELRGLLGLPAPAPIDPAVEDVEQLPLGRVPRLKIEAVDDEQLVQLYRRAMMAGAAAAVAHTAREAVRRPSLAERLPPREAYQRLIGQEDDTPTALALVEEARAASDAASESNAIWDLLELELHVVEGAPEEANRLLQHLRAEHIEEPGVAEQLYQLLYALGATPDAVPAGAAADPAPPMPGLAPAPGAEPAAAGAGKIWTPQGESGGGGGKLWTPS